MPQNMNAVKEIVTQTKKRPTGLHSSFPKLLTPFGSVESRAASIEAQRLQIHQTVINLVLTIYVPKPKLGFHQKGRPVCQVSVVAIFGPFHFSSHKSFDINRIHALTFEEWTIDFVPTQSNFVYMQISEEF